MPEFFPILIVCLIVSLSPTHLNGLIQRTGFEHHGRVSV